MEHNKENTKKLNGEQIRECATVQGTKNTNGFLGRIKLKKPPYTLDFEPVR